MSGFAFAAIYKEPTPPGPGPGPTPGPDPGPDPEPEPTYTISGTSIKPFVPFTVTVTGSSNTAKGSGGNLQADIDYEIRDGGEWSGGTRTWELGTRVCDSSRTNAKFSWLINGKEPVTATLAYDAGTMTPELTKDTLTLGETFGFTITYSHGQNCYATRFADFGASYWWEAQKNGTWERTNRIPVNQTPSFSNGVLSGNAYIGNLTGYDKIRLCVSYAGRNTVYTEAALVASNVTITLGADSLHCFGAATSLEIESDSLELMTAAFYRSDETTDDITDTNGTPIAFSFSGTTWTGNIQAATAATAGTVVLKVFYNNEVVATKQINIATALYGEIEADTPIMQGESIEATGTINGGSFTITRIPAETVKLEVDSGALEYNAAGEDTIELSYLPTTAGTYTLLLVDTRDETILDQQVVEVTSVFAALKEAIEERYRGKGDTMTVESIDMGILAAHAINAMNGYIKGAIGSDGSYTTYNSNNTGIVISGFDGTDIEWAVDTYGKICQAVSISHSFGSGDKETSIKRKRSGTVYAELEEDEHEDPIGMESLTDLITRACGECNGKQWENESQYEGLVATVFSITGQEGHFIDKNDYIQHWCNAMIDCCAERYKIGAACLVSGQCDLYFTGEGTYLSSYSTLGHRAPSAAGATEKLGTVNFTAGADSYSNWFGTEYSNLVISGNSLTGSVGYKMSLARAIKTYNFKHK